MLTRNNYHTIIKILLFIGIVYFPIFLHLEYLPIRIWDESRLALNAYEMHENGNFLVTYFKGNPDMWNTKPPLMIWSQVFFIKLFGVGELAIRLPAALAAFLTCVVLIIFSLKYLKSYWFGLFAVIILITSKGFISVHGAKTGDYDSLLVFFLTLSSLAFFMYLQNIENNKKYIYFFFIGLILAVLTKGIVGLMLTPTLFLFTLIKKKLVFILKDKHFYINLGIFIIIVFGYYFLRELKNPGYIKAVFDNELGGRYMDTLGGHKHGFWYFYKNIINERFKIWYWIVPIGVIIGFIHRNKKIKSITLFTLLIIVQYFLTISFSHTKLSWYDLPLYPFLSVLVSIPIFWIFTKLRYNKFLNSNLFYKTIPFLIVIAIFISSYQSIINKVFKPKENPWDQEFYNISYFMKDAVKSNKNFNNHLLVYHGYNAHLYFYTKLLNDKKQNIKIISKEEIKGSETIIADQKETKEYIEDNFLYEIIEKYKNVNVYKLEKPRLNE